MLAPERVQRRSIALVAGLAFFFSLLAAQLFNLQFRENQRWAVAADKNRIRIVPITAPRGNIYDRNGRLLATMQPEFAASIVYTSKEEIEKQTIPRLARILTQNEPDKYQAKVDEIKQKIEKQKQTVGLYQPVRVAVGLSPDVVTRLEERRHELPGVNVEVLPVRHYPENQLAAHLLGYVGEISDTELKDPKNAEFYRLGDIIGKAGLERYYEEYLRGQTGGKQVQVDRLGRYLQDLGVTPPVPGRDLWLTIDYNLQKKAEEVLQARMKEIREQIGRTDKVPATAHAGAVVAIDVNTGEVLAMASYPAFNPNDFVTVNEKMITQYINDKLFPLMNRAIAGEYAPGSTFKMITATAALAEGVTSPYEIVISGDRYWDFHRPKEWKPGGHGPVNLTRALALSSDIYFYEMGRRLGPDRLSRYAAMYGIGQKTGIDLYGEEPGLNPTKATYGDQWFPGEILSLAIGQGRYNVTALQLASYVAQIANGGTRYRPRLMKEVRDPVTNRVEAKAEPQVVDRLALPDPSILKFVKEGMKGVLSDGGTANAFIYPEVFPVPAAGKTGSAELGPPNVPDNGLFVAFAPYDKPEIAVAVIVEGAGGGARIAPIAREIMRQYFLDRGVIKPPPPKPAPPAAGQPAAQPASGQPASRPAPGTGGQAPAAVDGGTRPAPPAPQPQPPPAPPPAAPAQPAPSPGLPPPRQP